MREGHGRERNPMMDMGSENRLIYPVGSRDEENYIRLGIFEAFYEAPELLSGDILSDDVTIDDEAFCFFEVFTDASALFAADYNRISRTLRFDLFDVNLSFEAGDVFSN